MPGSSCSRRGTRRCVSIWSATIEHARSLGYDPSALLSLPDTTKDWRKRVQDCTESVLEHWLDGNLAVGRIITDEPGRN